MCIDTTCMASLRHVHVVYTLLENENHELCCTAIEAGYFHNNAKMKVHTLKC